MAARKKRNVQIAQEDEVLECLTSVLRSADDADTKIAPRDRLRAAELLAKRYGALDKTDAHADAPRIINDIPKTPGKDAP